MTMSSSRVAAIRFALAFGSRTEARVLLPDARGFALGNPSGLMGLRLDNLPFVILVSDSVLVVLSAALHLCLR